MAEKEELKKEVKKTITSGIKQGLEEINKELNLNVKTPQKLQKLEKFETRISMKGTKALYTITILDIVCWILAITCFITPLFLIAYYELWLFGLALLSVILAKSIPLKLIVIVFTPIYLGSIMLFGYVIDATTMAYFIFYYNTFSLGLELGVGIAAIILMIFISALGVISGLTGRRFLSGLAIVGSAIALAIVDTIVYFIYINPDIIISLNVLLIRFIAYAVAFVVNWTIMFILAKIIYIGITSISSTKTTISE